MIEVIGRKGRPSLGTHMERQIQRGRWEESSNRSNRFFLSFLVLVDFTPEIPDYSGGVDSLVSSKVQGAQEVGL